MIAFGAALDVGFLEAWLEMMSRFVGQEIEMRWGIGGWKPGSDLLISGVSKVSCGFSSPWGPVSPDPYNWTSWICEGGYSGSWG